MAQVVLIPQVLRGVQLFSVLRDADLMGVAEVAELRDVVVDTVLQAQNQCPAWLYVLVSGMVSLSAREVDTSATLSVPGEGKLFPLEPVLGDLPSLFEVRATRRSRVVAVPAAYVRYLVDTDHAFCRQAVLEITDISRERALKLHAQRLRNSTQRLALWILETAEESGHFEIPFEKRTLASLLGMTPESLIRSFHMLEPAVRKTAFKKYQVVDPDRLREIARPSPMLRLH
jgi:CRP/FNR family transcriptional regulator, transcriptional activator FtrB